MLKNFTGECVNGNQTITVEYHETTTLADSERHYVRGIRDCSYEYCQLKTCPIYEEKAPETI